jgi:DNA-binding CsgD family transcriptional regulator
VDDDVAVHSTIEKLLSERLHRLQQVSGVPVVFGGATQDAPDGARLVLSRLAGTLGDSLRGLRVQSGRGLGGAVLQRGVACRVNDYASTTTISHEYDCIVVGQERLTSIFAVPVVLQGSVRGVLYGGVRGQQPIGDRALRNAGVIAAQLQRDVAAMVARPDPAPSAVATPSTAALADLAAVIRGTSDPVVRTRLARIHRELSGRTDVTPHPAPTSTVLAPRELDALRLVAVGASNVEIATQLGLSAQTVKAYLRTAMRKLDVHNRTAAVHAARVAGLL